MLFYTDSRLLSDAVGKEHARHYENELNELLTSMNDFKTVVVQWVPEKENQGAHQLANQALHELINQSDHQ